LSNLDDGRQPSDSVGIVFPPKTVRNTLSENACGDSRKQLALFQWLILRHRRNPKNLTARGHAQLPFQKIFAIDLVAMNPKSIRIAIKPSTAELLAEMRSIVCENVIDNTERLVIDGPSRRCNRP
jgi:hypothetical protein